MVGKRGQGEQGRQGSTGRQGEQGRQREQGKLGRNNFFPIPNS